MATIAVDFDGVFHRYSRGWHDGSLYDPPLNGAVDGLRVLMARYAVYIHTTRDPEQVMPYMIAAGFDATTDERCRGCNGRGSPNETSGMAPLSCTRCDGKGVLTFWNTRGVLLITQRKLPALGYVDDRAVRFTNWDDVLVQVEALR